MTSSRTRPPSVWAALSLQTALTAITAYSCVQILASWSRYAAVHTQLLARDVVPAAILAISLIGLWSDKSWGWILALVADCTMCAEVLWFILNYPGLTRRASFLAFNLLEFAAVAALAQAPVREHFSRRQPRARATSQVGVQSSGPQTQKWVRIVIYFGVATVVTCAATAFSLAVFMGPKSGGNQGFQLFFVFGITTGEVASMLFVFVLTAAGRKFGSTRLWVWLLCGASLAPALIVTLGVLGRFLVVGVLYFVFWGPATLVQVWWLTPPIGVVIGWICYLMYPWAYPVDVSTQALRSQRQ